MTDPFVIVHYADEEVWLELRKEGVGGSDAAAILGLSNYSSPLQIWLEKRGFENDFKENRFTKWGKILESVIADEFERNHPELMVTILDAILRSKVHTFMQASIDRLLVKKDGTRGILEIKTAGAHMVDAWKDGVPDYYKAQVLHYLAVTGFSFAYVAVLIGGNDYKEYTISRDEDDIAYLIEQESKFWEMVKTGKEPALVGNRAESGTIRTICSNPEDEISYCENIHEKAQDLKDVKHEIKILDDKKRLLENEIKLIIGNSKGVQDDLVKVTWSRFKRSKIDSTKLKAEYQDVYDACVVEIEGDSGLRISELKGK